MNRRTFLLAMHHIITDGWSMGILIREVAALYRRRFYKDPSPLPDLPIQYADYAVWQRAWLQGEELERQLSYWKDRLGHAPPLLELPTARQRPAVQTYQGASQMLNLPEPLSSALTRLSRDMGATLFMTLLAAFEVLLYRYTGQDDVVVGVPIANRSRKRRISSGSS
jgi:hypothetical protein